VLTSLIEGQFKNGKLNGYARVMNFETEICMVGFWAPKTAQTETWNSIA